MENQQQESVASSLCKAGCGFFGNSSTEGLCSKCFKDSIKKKQDTGRATSPSSITSSDNAKLAAMRDIITQQTKDFSVSLETAMANAQAKVAGSTASLSSSSSSASLAIETAVLSESVGAEPSTSSDSSAPTAKNKPNRCHVCKKRVGLTGFPCRCGGLYCGEHRYDTAHGCEFDYKQFEREEIRKNNPVVCSEKIQRI